MAGMLAGKTALITGGGRGIGRATALLFAKEGARVVASDVSADGAAETVGMINAAGGQALAIGGDVTRAGDVAAMMTRTLEAFGRIDCAFNNAGIAAYQLGVAGKKTADWTEEAFDRMIAVNLKGVWLCMRAELEQMVRQKCGVIVNTASIAGLVGLETSSAYVAAKHGVIGLTKTAAIEYAKDGIRVNAVCPGFIETDMTKDTMSRRGDQILARVPARRMGTAEEIAEMVCWLCSDRAAFATGVAYNVDGGYVAI
ncbi:MAG TPA: glucose 1-dehydrogenase [Rhabdaerophilum sp.]|nr:glucose 1-dehydrogenase [Rhabdaerophilum sp.]